MKKLFPLAVALAVMGVVFATIFIVSQQAIRVSANDPQIQLAQDAASKLNLGADPNTVATGKVDVGVSLAPFVNIYKRDGSPVAGSGYLGATVAKPPVGMLKASDSELYNAVTWEPSNGVRIAAVAVKANHYYVVSGRSLSEDEKREDQTFDLVAFGWLITATIITSYYVVLNREMPKIKSRKK